MPDYRSIQLSEELLSKIKNILNEKQIRNNIRKTTKPRS